MDYPEDFQKAVDDLIDNWEGGYEDDPDDPGEETKFGISKRSYRALNIAALTRDEAVAIYYWDFWQKYHLEDKVADPELRAKVFNMGVLMGPITALALAANCPNVTVYRNVCAGHFQAIALKHPAEQKYLKGWLRRAMA